MKKYLASVCAVIATFGTAAAQVPDSVGNLCLVPAAQTDYYFDRQSSTKSFRMTYVAAPLIVGGFVVSFYDQHFRHLRNGYVHSFRHHYDDYLQYGSAGVMLGMKAFGVEGRSSWGRMLTSDAFSAALMGIMVNSMKYSFEIMRPDGSSKNSFPSGHSAMSFMTATMLHKEYGYRSPWYSIGAYTLATSISVTRMLNNRHWMSDVMVGAGIGILSTELGYYLADLIFKERGLNVDSYPISFDRYRRPSFVSVTIGLTTIPGYYRPAPGMKTSFLVGPTADVQGAWFATPYVGVGGRFSVSSHEVSINRKPQNDNLESYSFAGGLYFSYPVSMRWQVGSKLLGGYERYRSCETEFLPLGKCDGFVLATGFSTTYVASENLGVRFSTNYDMAPPFAEKSHQKLHKLTFSIGACALF